MPLSASLAELSSRMRPVLPPIASTDLDAAEARRRANLRFEIAAPRSIPVASVDDSSVPCDGRDPRVRIFRPGVAPDPPALLFLHSGGWVTGGLHMCDATCRRLALDTGAVVIALEYSLAPEYPYPAALDETIATIEWMRTNARSHRFDPERIAIAGESAGGNLALAALLRIRDSRSDPPVACLLIVPVVDHDDSRPSYRQHDRGEVDKRSGMHWYMRQYLPQFDEHIDDPYAWPVRAPSMAGLPPIVLVTVEYDPLLDEQRELEQRLLSARSSVERLHYESVTHGFFGLDHLEPISRRAQLDVASRLKRFLAKSPAHA